MSGRSGEDAEGGGLVRGRRVVLGVVGGAALMAVGGLLATTVVKSPAQAAAETGPPAQAVLTATVERRVLAATVVMRGQVVADQSVEVTAQGVRAGTAASVVTKLPLKAGDPVQAGQLVAEISGRPVFALRGALPMYRDLKPGAVGDDVAQLQEALRDLGHGTGADARGVFGAGTKAALTARYRALGYDALPAVPDSAATIKAAREAVRSAEDSVDALADALTAPADAPGAAVTGAVPGAAGKPPSGQPGGTGRALGRARTALAEARAGLAAAEAADGPMLPASEAVFLGGFPARVSGLGVRLGATVTGGPVLTLSAGELVVEAYLKEDKKQLLRAGMSVAIASEASGNTARGKVVSVGAERSFGQPPAQAQQPPSDQKGAGGVGGGGVDLGYRMVVRADQALPAAFAGQDVRLTVESASTDGEALVVPVTAVSAGADGRTVVTAVSADGTQRRIEVATGTTGDGCIAVTPARRDDLAAGAKVVIGAAPAAPKGSAP